MADPAYRRRGDDQRGGIVVEPVAAALHGRKREEILLRSGKKDLLRIRAAHEYDTVIYSVPPASGQNGMELLIQ